MSDSDDGSPDPVVVVAGICELLDELWPLFIALTASQPPGPMLEHDLDRAAAAIERLREMASVTLAHRVAPTVIRPFGGLAVEIVEPDSG